MTIADGHHRYETALRFRDERRMSRSCEEDPAFDYILTLFLEATGEPLTVLPTHRIVRGLAMTGSRPSSRLGELFDVGAPVGADALRESVADRPRCPREAPAVRAVDPRWRADPGRAPSGLRAFPPTGARRSGRST